MPEYFNIILGLFDQIHRFLDHFVFDAYHTLADTIKIPLALSMAIYIVLLGYGVSQGWIDLPINRIVRIALKLSVIYTLAMNWDFFSRYVIDFIQEGSNQLGGLLLESNKSISINPQHGIEGALQSVLIHFTKIGYWLWRRGSWHSVSPYCEAIAIWGAGLALIIYATFQLILADVMLSILFVLAPLFVAFLIFSSTQRLFDRWAGHIISYSLLIIFISVLLSLILGIAEWSVSEITEHNLLTTLFITSFVPIMLVCFVSIGLIKRVTVMAHDIGLNFSTFLIKRFSRETVH